MLVDVISPLNGEFLLTCAPQKLDSLFDLPIEAQPVDAVA
jgi:hypothetical protein